MSGVQTLTVKADEADQRLDRWFRKHFPHITQGQLQKLLRTGQVRVDGKRVEAKDHLAAGQMVRVPPLPDDAAPPSDKPKVRVSAKEAAELQARVLYRDEDVIVLDKPAGLAVQGGTGQVTHLDAMLDALRFGAEERPKLVHRLDRDTSGCLVLARNTKAAAFLGEAFRSHEARKYYWAVTVGTPSPYQGKIDLAIAKETGTHGERMAPDEEDGKRAVSLYQVIENAGKRAAWVALWPRTGRTHQLRVHMNAIGTPILGDGKYGGQNAFLSGAEVSKALHLHAHRLILPHPRGGVIDVRAPLPGHMLRTWSYFEFGTTDDGDPFAAVKD